MAPTLRSETPTIWIARVGRRRLLDGHGATRWCSAEPAVLRRIQGEGDHHFPLSLYKRVQPFSHLDRVRLDLLVPIHAVLPPSDSRRASLPAALQPHVSLLRQAWVVRRSVETKSAGSNGCSPPLVIIPR